ncbi:MULTISPECIES: glycosyltransferase [unclassified Salipiger]|uniref:CgeB family protein n=1 Tax=unclassified Salipiger TaxID=2640570 RepID=UPI0013BCD190|nr:MULTISPECIES: glycosyltransferase [unclassified Salipiger]NDV49287.1 glycosyltransferase [Salipiger sp. PrR003]NDW32760.1 glycosyltransferase [Salipiger sp. PrR007]
MSQLAFYGSSLLSSYWNGAATYYRGIIKALAARGWEVTFHEPDVWERGRHRDIDPPDWCRVNIWEGSAEGLRNAAAEAARAQVVVVASGIGYEDSALRQEVLRAARPDALRVWWDVDAPATLATLQAQPLHPLRRDLPAFDQVLTYGGGTPVVDAYLALNASACMPIYNALDPETHHPVPGDPRFAADLAFLGNRLPDRETRVDHFFLDPASRLPDRRFLLGGAGWEGRSLPPNVAALGHVGTALHNAFNATPLAVLNIARDSMAAAGFSPATRVFEAAGAGACLVTDAWDGIEQFLEPGREVLVARDGSDVLEILEALRPEQAAAIGTRARARLLEAHTYTHRADQISAVLMRGLANKTKREAPL